MPLFWKNLSFYTEAHSEDTLDIESVEGTEAMSSPFSFELQLISNLSDIDSAKIIDQPATICLRCVPGNGGEMRVWKGIVSEFEQLGSLGGGRYRYRAVMVSKLWQLSLTHRSRVFLKQTIPQIIATVLGPVPHRLSLNRTYAAKEFVVQYQESDLDFLARWLENEGIFYYFEHGTDRELVVFADGRDGYAACAPVAIPYSPDDPGWWQERISKLVSQRKRIPQQVVLQDYNWKTPGETLRASAAVDPVDARGVGEHYEYANHYDTVAEGTVLAVTRAQEIFCREITHSGESLVSTFRPGARFTMSGHYHVDLNGVEYLLTSVTHKASQPANSDPRVRGTCLYDNRFTAIPAARTFRPTRRAPWPRITGTMHAVIDGVMTGAAAPVDSQGRYQVKLPFDLATRPVGQASHAIRMAQPYAGTTFGMHFPLHPGTEVVLAFLDGDPDRPIITGALNDPQHPSIITAKNASTAGIKTASGNMVGFHDDPGSTRVTIGSGNAGSAVTVGSSKIGPITKNSIQLYSTQFEVMAGVLAAYNSTLHIMTSVIKNALITSPIMAPFMIVPIMSKAGQDGVDPIFGQKIKESDQERIQAGNQVMFTLITSAGQVALLQLLGTVTAYNAKVAAAGNMGRTRKIATFVATYIESFLRMPIGGFDRYAISLNVAPLGLMSKMETTSFGKHIALTTANGSIIMKASESLMATVAKDVTLSGSEVQLVGTDPITRKGGGLTIDDDETHLNNDTKVCLHVGVGPLPPLATSLVLKLPETKLTGNKVVIDGFQKARLISGPVGVVTASVDADGALSTVKIEGKLKVLITSNLAVEITVGASKISIGPAGIELSSAGSSIKVGAAGVAIKSASILGLEGTASATLKSAGMLSLDGSLVQIKGKAPVLTQ